MTSLTREMDTIIQKITKPNGASDSENALRLHHFPSPDRTNFTLENWFLVNEHQNDKKKHKILLVGPWCSIILVLDMIGIDQVHHILKYDR